MDTADIVTIIVSLIGAAATVLTVIMSNNRHALQSDAKLEKALAVIETRQDELTREVREHNNFARRMPVVEEKIEVINHRLKDLENKGGKT